MHKSIFSFVILIICCIRLLAWAPQVQKNFLNEAVRILPWFQYLMCLDYKASLTTGIVEAEYEFWFFHGGNCPGLVKRLKAEKIKYIRGWNFQREDIAVISGFLAEKFNGMKRDIRNGQKRYDEIMFELGYFLHSINNFLKPPYIHEEKLSKGQKRYHAQCTMVARNTDSIDLRTEKIEKIDNLKSWLEKMLEKNIKLRDRWYAEAESGRSSFKEDTLVTCENNIYNLASIIFYVLNNLNPMKPELKNFLYMKVQKKFKGGRKPLGTQDSKYIPKFHKELKK